MERIIESAGLIVTMDAFVKDPSVLNKEVFYSTFIDLAKKLDMQILGKPKFTEVPIDPEILKRAQETGEFHDEGGTTGFCIINKSHISIHAWPLQKFFSLDVFSCSDYDPQIAIDTITDKLGVKSSSINIIKRKKPVLQKPAVYCITNKINGKRYIGKSKDSTARWGKHVWLIDHPDHPAFSLVHRALTKYGQDNFIFQTLEVCQTDKEAYEKEKRWVAFFKTNNQKYGYNLTEGGIGFSGLSAKAKERRAVSKKGRNVGVKNPMFGKKGALHPGFGKPRSEEFKKKLSEMRRGEKNPMFGKGVSKFTASDIDQIKKYRKEGLTHKKIALKFGVSSPTISNILNGKCKTLI